MGMVTLENILEELVGQIQDEFDQEKPLLARTGDNTWEAAGTLPLHELEELVGEPLREEGITTLSGWVTQRLGGFPKVGDVLTIGACELRVEEMAGMRVARLKLSKRPAPAPKSRVRNLKRSARAVKTLAEGGGLMLGCAYLNRRLPPIQLLKSAVLQAAFWLLVWAMFASASVLAADGSYTVKRGRHRLHSIAQRYGISPAVLAERNGLSRNSYIYTGQRLIIPAKSRPPGVRRASRRAEDRAPLRCPGRSSAPLTRRRCGRAGGEYIVIHHSGMDTGTVKAMDKYHREVRHMENGLAYHFVIGNGSGMGDGEIAVSRRWTQQLDGGHLASEAQNKVAIGICLVGNFDQAPAHDARRWRACGPWWRRSWRGASSRRVPSKRISRSTSSTPAVPGRKFPTRSFLDSLSSRTREWRG